MALHLSQWPQPPSPDTAEAYDLILLHGFTQNRDCWGPLAPALAERHRVTAVDAPGHGRSSHDDADLWETADLLAEAVDAVAGPRPPTVIGYSMGGRMALHLALAHPDRVGGLVLIGATAGIDSPDDRAARRQADGALADRLRNEPLEQFLDGWLANPLFAGLDPESACREARLANRPEGLAASLLACGTGSQEPLWDRLGEITVPVLLVVGSEDHKFSAIARRLADGLSAAAADLAVIEGTHAVHLERPEETAEVILGWLDDQVDQRSTV